jgi:hypothetical protein
MRRRALAAVAGLVVAGAAVAALVTGVVQPDVYPSLATYGVSVGGQLAYCSAEIVRWAPEFSCQNGS